MQIQSVNTKSIYSYEPNGERSLCPECSHLRKKKEDKCLAWDNKENRGYCHNCLTAFFEYHPRVQKEYTYPLWSNKTSLSDNAVRFFEGRMIAQPVLNKMRVYSDVTYMQKFSKNVPVICFPYFRGDKLINIKYRGPEKSFKLVKDAELIFWNIDCLSKFDDIIIVEGEIDCLTMIQAGFENTISVPNGAARNLDYLDPGIFKGKVFIAVDQDSPGIELRDSLIHKLGAERCKVVSFEDCKDANEYLCKYGDKIKDVIMSATPVPDEYEKLKAKLRIDPTIDIGEPPACCYINGIPLTFGEISLWDGKKKSGKTFLIGATVAAMIANKMMIDKIKGNLPPVRNVVLYFDTEQSSYHANRSIKRICKLIGNVPLNLIAFGLRPLNAEERLSFIEKTIRQTENLAVVVVDGVRDLLSKGINDEPEATKVVSLFLKWTGDYNIHMPVILHQNKADNNARGHIGSELGNKAEAIITITKDKKSDLFLVSCEDSKDKNFDDFAFTVDESGIIQSSDMPQEIETKSKNPQYIDDQKYFEILDKIFKDEEKIPRIDFASKIKYAFGNIFGDNICRNFITYCLEKGWIDKIKEKKEVFYVYKRAIF
jgi:5S rRNA maturation endonuclease (ribonuclease M5)